jgi:molybdopterin-guanine dinucleotide biosynthesis protein MobB
LKTIGIIGRKDSGKTHLVVRLVAEFRRRGLSVSTIKHTHHHDVELDVPGKDSYRHREAGAAEVIVASDRGWFLVHPAAAQAQPPSLADLVARLAPCDLVLVEGYKGLSSHPRIEVYRPGTTALEPLAAADPGIGAVACPPQLALARWPAQATRLALDDTAAIAGFILAQ